MKAELVNPFLNECRNIFREAAAIDLKYEKVSLKNSPVSTGELMIMIGITGDLRGSVIINMSNEFAKRIASNMMGGMEVLELNELAKSAIAELGNMIMGRVSTTFSRNGIMIDITPPSLITGENVVLSVLNVPLLSIKFTWDEYDLDFDVSVVD